MRFRLLSKEELTTLEQDFIKFLASNQITADEWVKLKKENMEKVEELIILFSDIVFEKVMSKIEYLQHRSTQVLRVFHCEKEKIVMTGLEISDATKDLTNPEDLALLTNEAAIKGDVRVFQMEKPYGINREEEIFGMIYKNQCQMATKEMFDMLSSMYSK